MLKAVDATTLVLIPRNGKAEQMDQYCPIALWNILENCRKLIVKMLKFLLLKIITASRRMFVLGRQITYINNVVETINSLETQRSRMMIKHNILKAFDRYK